MPSDDGIGQVAAEEEGMHQAGWLPVVDIGTGTGDQSGIFDPAHGAPKGRGAHRLSLRNGPLGDGMRRRIDFWRQP
jgi:hypothetical protein